MDALSEALNTVRHGERNFLQRAVHGALGTCGVTLAAVCARPGSRNPALGDHRHVPNAIELETRPSFSAHTGHPWVARWLKGAIRKKQRERRRLHPGWALSALDRGAKPRWAEGR